MRYFSFIHTDKIKDNDNDDVIDTCMCGLIKCSHYCPAKYADTWETLEANDNLAPYLGSGWDVIDHVFDLVNISKETRILDLGAGDGRVLIRAIQRGALDAVGYELNKHVYELGISQVKEYEKIKLYHGDCRYVTDIAQFNLVTLFLLPEGLMMLEPFLSSHYNDEKNKQNKQVTIVSLGWPIPKWQIEKKAISQYGTSIYIYSKLL